MLKPTLRALGLCVFLLSPSAFADGGPSLEQARDAWNRGELQQAEPLYAEALAKGGLKRDQTLECYVHLGAIRAVLGKKDSAQAAFRTAALIDASFVVPSEAGKRAVQLADTVRKQQLGFGELALKLELPQNPKAGAPISVVVTMDGAHTTFFARVGLIAKEGTSGKTFNFELSPAETMHFTVPASLTLPDGDISVHIEALDKADNQLALSEGKVHVSAAAPITSDTKKPGKGFWSTPWPYVIGGAVLSGAAASTVGIFFVTQSSAANINVGAPTIRPGG